MIGLMAKKPTKKKLDSKRTLGVDRHLRPREAFHMPQEVHDALETFARGTDPPSTKTAVILAALMEYLQRRGALPAKPAQPRKE